MTYLGITDGKNGPIREEGGEGNYIGLEEAYEIDQMRKTVGNRIVFLLRLQNRVRKRDDSSGEIR